MHIEIGIINWPLDVIRQRSIEMLHRIQIGRGIKVKLRFSKTRLLLWLGVSFPYGLKQKCLTVAPNIGL